MGQGACSAVHQKGETWQFLLHLLDNKYSRARQGESWGTPVASAAHFLIPVWFLLTFRETFCRVLELFFYLGLVLKLQIQVIAEGGRYLLVKTLCSHVLGWPNRAVLLPGLVLFTGHAGQCCGYCSIKEGSKVMLSLRFVMRSLFLTVSWELESLPWL